MRLPRDLSGADLVRHLGQLGYAVSRQTGSHMRLTCSASHTHGEHHITIPNHDPLRIGTLAAILESVAVHHGMTRDQLLQKMLG
jgi:predicted RNA binding protein YcfA (HicA-like mRNA interferase family)